MVHALEVGHSPEGEAVEEHLRDGERQHAEPHAADAEELAADLARRGARVVERADALGLGEERGHPAELLDEVTATGHGHGRGEVVVKVRVLIAPPGLGLSGHEHGDHQPDRHPHEEGPAPAAVGDGHAATDEPDERAGQRARLVEAHVAGPVLGRVVVGDQRDGGGPVGLDRAHAHAEDEQQRVAGGDGVESHADGPQRDGGGEEPRAPDAVGEDADGNRAPTTSFTWTSTAASDTWNWCWIPSTACESDWRSPLSSAVVAASATRGSQP